MKRRRIYGRHRLSRDAERLAWLAQGLADSGSRLEDAWLEAEIGALIERLLRAGEEDALNQALDRLHETNARAYDELADLIEAGCEVSRVGDTARLIIALPVLAWSRYAIPTRSVPKATLDALRAQLGAHVLGAEARAHFADYLFSPDQLPQGYAETRAFADELWNAAAAGKDLKVDTRRLTESQVFVSDVRYLLASVQVPVGRPVFRWNEAEGGRPAALAAWREQGGPNFQNLLTGCAYELLLPDAYFAAWRQADRDTRPFALKAAVEYLKTLFNEPANRIRAIAAPYYEHWLEEWRIAFTLANSDDVVHGVTWPLLGHEDENADLGAEIETLLKSTGIGEVRILDTRMPLEYCDDCGAPLFPNPDGENVHAELPEDMQGTPAQLH
ncbi:MAG: hypothetical protein FD187_854 [bacterium]|nr:MAG: hypothetical protein FD142_569 [bacterium]KAF0149897.1 MAG: hypothetical protein FD187_854 [bacterium]KAF0166359.1 MAG: hypothetical protein FD158_2643 [bacterium]TXT16982.1 MAG: hypothetical protein FD132_2617 [bacterium]